MAHMTYKKCGFSAPEMFFQREVKRDVVSRVKRQLHRAVCLMCRQEEQDKHKRGDRTVPKARNMLYTHCDKYNRSRYGGGWMR